MKSYLDPVLEICDFFSFCLTPLKKENGGDESPIPLHRNSRLLNTPQTADFNCNCQYDFKQTCVIF